jgi:hypothetical protein
MPKDRGANHNRAIEGPLPEKWDTPKLKQFWGNDNRISGPLPAALLRQPRLEKLLLHNNQLSGPIPASVAHAPALQVLRLDHNRLSGTVPDGLGRRLMVYDVSNNPELEAAR